MLNGTGLVYLLGSLYLILVPGLAHRGDGGLMWVIYLLLGFIALLFALACPWAGMQFGARIGNAINRPNSAAIAAIIGWFIGFCVAVVAVTYGGYLFYLAVLSL